jgi:hypothetical protein
MTTKYHLARLAILAILFSFSGQALAQSTTLQTLQGSRHDGPGRVATSASTFAVGITRDNGATFVSTASVADTVQIRGEIRPEPANVGLAADIFVVDRLLDTGAFLMRNQAGVWVPWGATVSTLVPFLEKVTLTTALSVDMFSGTLGTAGNHRIFLGYLPPDGILRYHTSGLPVTITAQSQTQTPQQQANALFAAKISPNIVPQCAACHFPGTTIAPTASHTFVDGNGSAELTSNFNSFKSLLTLRGKAFILAKVRGDNSHQGGQIFSANSQSYRDLDEFLTLLGQF